MSKLGMTKKEISWVLYDVGNSAFVMPNFDIAILSYCPLDTQTKETHHKQNQYMVNKHYQI